ncbi:hypothetical protein ATY30_02535 [Sinorhizobium americanum]|uniref:Uncharacterized protein n=1 Tax=Sinorhizobium americanum TaxID=194963 RepID=A0A2S3YNA9_9HYPH|nr:hypothetical protein ATY31_14780 [Sinorhizobium americanum]POH33316.1 hypothetical protein ATY30_02535 [Sinorhizobium americanum]
MLCYLEAAPQPVAKRSIFDLPKPHLPHGTQGTLVFRPNNAQDSGCSHGREGKIKDGAARLWGIFIAGSRLVKECAELQIVAIRQKTQTALSKKTTFPAGAVAREHDEGTEAIYIPIGK